MALLHCRHYIKNAQTTRENLLLTSLEDGIYCAKHHVIPCGDQSDQADELVLGIWAGCKNKQIYR